MKTFRNVLFFYTRVFRWCHLRTEIIVQSLGALKENKSLYFLWHRYNRWGASSLQIGWLKNPYIGKGNWIPGMNSGAGKSSWYSSLYSQLFLGDKHCLPFEKKKKWHFFNCGGKKVSLSDFFWAWAYLLAARNHLFSEAKTQVTGPM